MQSKVPTNYTAIADDSKKARNKGENEKQQSTGSFDLHHSEAHTFQSIGEFKKAIASYSKALEVKPKDKKCLIARARCYLKIGNAEKALDDSNEIHVNDPEYVKSLLIKADALHQLTQFEYALIFYHRGRQLRPEMREFAQGIQRAEEAIYNAIGENSGIVFKVPHNIQDFCEELDIQKKLSLSILASTKLKLLEKSETSDSIGSGNKTSRTSPEEKKGGDQGDNDNEKSSKKQEMSSISNDLEVDEAALEKKVKMMNSSKSCKQLLGELYADKEFLESLLNETEVASNQSDANKQIRSLTIKELNFLGTRSDFWQQQKPLYSRNHEKALREQSYLKNKSETQSSDWTEEDLKAIENAQSQGRYKESLEKAQKLLKSLENLPGGGSKMARMTTIYSFMGTACMELGEDKQALKWCQCEYEYAAKNKIPDSETKALRNMGRLHMRMGNFKAALKQFQKCSKKEISDEKSWLMHEMGRCWFEMERFKKAEECGKKSLEFAKEEYDEPWQLKALILIGQSQEKRNQNQLALDNYKEALLLSQTLDDSSAEEVIKRTISDLEVKVQGCDEGVQEETSGDDIDSYDEDDEENEIESDHASSERFSVVSMSGLSSSQMSSVCGRISKQVSVPAKAKSCPQSKDQKTSKHEVKNSKESKKISTNKSNYKKDENLKKLDGTGGDDDDGDEDGKRIQKKVLEKESKKTINYNVTVKTGNVFTAGTKSNVAMVIYGKYGKTENIPLTNPHNNPIPFEQGKTDKFVVKAADVGNIKQIKIFHSGTQMNDGWFLEEVSVTSPTFEEVYFFYVHRWLSKFNDDGKTTRTLEPTNVSLKPSADYKITLVSGAGSQLVGGVNIFVTIFGKYSRTEKIPIRLNPNSSEYSDESFVDKIIARGTDVKKITRIKVGLDNLKPHSKWHLEEVKIKILSKTYLFEAEKWFDKNLKGGSLEEELTPTQVFDKKSKSVQGNTILNQTKRRKNAHCVFAGCSNNGDENKEDGDAAADDDDDRGKPGEGNTNYPKSIKRTIAKEGGKVNNQSEGLKKKKKLLYTVEITTGNKEGAGTDADVFMVLYGKKANSSKFVLKGSSDQNAFQRGGLDVFKLECDDVGDISKIKIGHNGSKRNLGWFVESIKISTDTKTYLFKVGKWFDKEKGDGKTARCLKALSVTPQKEKDQQDSRNHNRGNEEKHENNKAHNSGGDDEDDNDDEGDDNSDEDKHDLIGKHYHKLSDGECDDTQNNEGKHIESSRKDETQSEENVDQNHASYRIEVKTGTCLGAGTDANVFIFIEGDKGRTDKILLEKKSADIKEQLFKRGRTNHFTVKAKDVGNVNGALIGHDGSNFGAGWFLEDLNIESASTGDVYHFHVSQWFDRKEGDGRIERHLLPLVTDKTNPDEAQKIKDFPSQGNNDDDESTSRSKHSEKVTYKVSVKTGSKLGAGTDANVYIILIGKNKKTERLYLKDVKKGDKVFERNSQDDFQLEADDVGKIQKIIVGHDGENMGSGWFLESIKVGSNSTKELYIFKVEDWLDKNEGDEKVEKELERTSVEKME